MDYDVLIIGAGLSGLAAGIRLAYFDKRVCIVEQHYAYGGMNSYYTLDGRKFDVGLHAVTNYAPPGARGAPLTKLLRQLRLDWSELDLHPQRSSEIRFPGRRLRFTNDLAVLTEEVAREFPRDIDRFRRLLAVMKTHDDARWDAASPSARRVLADSLTDRQLIDMLLCPVMFYGSAQEHDLDYATFATLFKSIFLQGFARPRGGVRRLLTRLVRQYRGFGGRLRMRCGVERILFDGDRAIGVRLPHGEEVAADVIFSCAGYPETMKLCGFGNAREADEEIGRLSFVESVAVLDQPAARLGWESTILFYNDAETFTYARPDEPADLRSGILCCPGNYEAHEDEPEEMVRLTWLADYDRWAGLSENEYRAQKDAYRERFLTAAERFIPALRSHVVATDLFTPRTIERYTGRMRGAVYGSPRKHREGRTPFRRLYVCGTDQGYLGIIGAMLSGVTMANKHVLAEE